ncbi:hypothetical protein [Methylobacter sp.]|uniref:hypothetical protein n=1 Tax=Methylobacter sp. TaxID=2051955 RepID=UPI0011F5A665|nr:hypothetical protein [Methylobacter sp.]TAK59517.1 MAG: hypothetical protein EPO18_20360 [Methylobacter sp.]
MSGLYCDTCQVQNETEYCHKCGKTLELPMIRHTATELLGPDQKEPESPKESDEVVWVGDISNTFNFHKCSQDIEVCVGVTIESDPWNGSHKLIVHMPAPQPSNEYTVRNEGLMMDPQVKALLMRATYKRR